MSESSNKEIYIAAVGASAGGLEALNKFFENISDDPGLAFVVIQHLSPDHESHMVNLLSKKTNMKVLEIKDGTKIEKNNVYLIPPKKNIKIIGEQLFLYEPGERDKRYLNLPIDIFFKPLAEEKGSKAISIILSGTGSDGARGVRAIKEHNGMVMVQKKDTAKFNGMPSNAIATGIVDYILAPEKMGDRLLKYVQHPYLNDQTKNVVDKSSEKDENYLSKTLSLIKEHKGIDFFQYKDNTVIRRIERRMIINQIDKLEHYYNFLEKSKFELNTLSRELLIGVTNFFRDEEAFEKIKNKIIPELIKAKENSSEIRIWTAGCSTGEEVYSLAILFMEYLEKHRGNYKVKIFATDIQEEVLRKASIGKYPGSIVADVSAERLSRFFVKEGKMYKINKTIRDMVIFSRHNLISDPPFHKIDLISCRNLLIYLKAGIQQKIISNFKFSLNDQGYLFLGSSESLGDMFSNFKVLDSRWNIFQCKNCSSSLKNVSNHNVNNVDISSTSSNLNSTQNITSKRSRRSKFEDKISQALLKDQISDTAVIDENNSLIHLVGSINDYLIFPENKVSLNIIDMCPNGLDQALSIAINKVKRDKEEVVYKGIEFNKGGKKRVIDLYLTPLFIEEDERELISIRFLKNSKKLERDLEVRGSIIEYNEDEHARQRIRDLEQELEYTRENLQATIEELETSNEELQATNEELMASNQQLQSTNEELESVNEELLTVNSEHQQKIEELTRLNNDMDNLLESTNIGTVFLDDELQVRKFTPVAQRIINLKDRDCGRPLKDISTDINYDNLYEDTKKVLETGNKIEEKILSNNNDWYLMKILPYKTRENNNSGIVITFININNLQQSNQELQKLYYAVENSPFITVITDQKGKITYANQKFEEVTEYSLDEIEGRRVSLLKSNKTDTSVYENLWQKILAGKNWQGEFMNRKKSGELYKEIAYIFPLLDKKGSKTHYIKYSFLPEQLKY